MRRTKNDRAISLRDRVMGLIVEYREKNLRCPIVVEGERDCRSLRSLGFHGDIYKVNSGLTLAEFSETMARGHRELILLMDFDSKGREITERLRVLLSSEGCIVDLTMWKRTKEMLNIAEVEEMHSAVERINQTKL